MQNENYFDGYHISTVRPSGTKVNGNNVATNNTTIIYTVAANYELMLAEWWHCTLFGAVGIGDLGVYNVVPALVYYLNRQVSVINTSLNIAKNVIPTHLIDEGYSIRLTSNAVALDTYGGITGYTYEKQ